MSQSSLILILAALDQKTAEAFQKQHNKARCVPPHDATAYGGSSREATPAPLEDGDFVTTSPRIVLSFGLKPKNLSRGFTFGSSEVNCDVVLGSNTSGISRIHFSINLDVLEEGRRLVLTDTSKVGTIVSFNGQQKRVARHRCILFSDVPVDIGIKARYGDIRMRVVQVDHSQSLAQYESNLRDYCRAAEDDLAMSTLDLASGKSTVLPSGAATPSNRRMYYDHADLGKGAAAKVSVVREVSTGAFFAGKKLINESFRRWWTDEVRLLEQVKHEHIVNYVDFVDGCLIMELVPLGNLENQIPKLSEEESIQCLHQCLQALAYLHGAGIVHRDIKPENILVQRRSPLLVKLSDFGLSSDRDTLMTFCGSPLYVAPEMRPESESDTGPYSPVVDIWSLGVVLLGCVYGFGAKQYPVDARGRIVIRRWQQQIINLINDQDREEIVILLSDGMLQEQPEKRWPAAKCLSYVNNSRVFAPILEPSQAPTTDHSADVAKDLDSARTTIIQTKLWPVPCEDNKRMQEKSDVEQSSKKSDINQNRQQPNRPNDKRPRRDETQDKGHSAPGSRDSPLAKRTRSVRTPDVETNDIPKKKARPGKLSPVDADDCRKYRLGEDEHAVLELLRDLRMSSQHCNEHNQVRPDWEIQSLVLVDQICAHLSRLNIVELHTVAREGGYTIAAIIDPSTGHMDIGNVSCQDMLQSSTAPAADLLRLLEAQLEGLESKNRKSQLQSVGERQDDHDSSILESDASSRELGLTFPSPPDSELNQSFYWPYIPT